jgi:hypothetical protein
MRFGVAAIAPIIAIASLAAGADGRRAALFTQDEPFVAMEGVLSNRPAAPVAEARQRCLTLPGSETEVLGPHGATLLSSSCRVVAYDTLEFPRWSAARYEWTLVFTAEDQARGPDARDTSTQEEVVLFDAVSGGSVRPVWHGRFDTTQYAVWRSMKPELAGMADGTTLLSIMTCVNGTGGCGQDFLRRHADGRWSSVAQTWLKQLPAGFGERMRHGVRIEPQTLHGEAGFYGDADANCCPSEILEVDLQVRGDALVLRGSPRIRKAER